MEPTTPARIVFWTVVFFRFALPLSIPRWPLPAILACLVVDALDQTIFQFFGVNPPFYQNYDKAMDVFYLAVAYISTLRNWTNEPATRISRLLFYLRLTGAVAFELSGWRAWLLILPNTFEYFFIAYETVRTRWNPARFGGRFWWTTAILIWVLVKIPQEYWIHIARLDFTDMFARAAWFRWTVLAGAVALGTGFWFGVRPRLAPAEHAVRFAADPLPKEIDEPREWAAHVARYDHVFSGPTLEKALLIGLTSIIFARVLPGVRSTDLQLLFGTGLFVMINAALSIWSARATGREIQSAALNFTVVLAVNIVLVLVFDMLLRRARGAMSRTDTAFFVLLFSLLVTLYDRYRPVYEVRFPESGAAGAGFRQGNTDKDDGRGTS